MPVNPFTSFLRLGHLLGNTRPLQELDVDTALTSIFRPAELVSVGARFPFLGEATTDAVVARAMAALGGQVDQAIIEAVRWRPLHREIETGTFLGSTARLPCWVKQPVILPTREIDLPLFFRPTDAEGSQLMNSLVAVDVVHAYTYEVGLVNTYAAGVLSLKTISAIDPVAMLYPWGVAPTTPVQHLAEGTVTAVAGPPYVLGVTVTSGTVDAGYVDGLCFDEELGSGCIISGVAVGPVVVTLHNSWLHATPPIPTDHVTMISRNHVVAGMVARLSGGHPDNDGYYLITEVTLIGELVLNRIGVLAPTSWTDLQHALPYVLRTGIGVPAGNVTILSFGVWFPVLEVSPVIVAIPALMQPYMMQYHAPTPEYDRAADTVFRLPDMIHPTVEATFKIFHGGVLTGHFSAYPDDSLYSVNARLNSATMNTIYRNGTRIASYQGILSNDPDDGRHIYIDGGPLELTDVALGAPGDLRNYEVLTLQRLVAISGNRAQDRLFDVGTPGGIDLVRVDTGVNPNLTLAQNLNVAAGVYTLTNVPMDTATSLLRSAAEHMTPTFLMFRIIGSYISAYVASMTLVAPLTYDLTLGFLETPPVVAPGNYVATTFQAYTPSALLAFPTAAPDMLSRPLSVFEQRAVPFGTTHGAGFVWVVPESTVLSWIDRNPAADTGFGWLVGEPSCLGYRHPRGTGRIADIVFGVSDSQAADQPLVHLHDTQEGIDGAAGTDLERTTLMLGSPSYDNDDLTATYFGSYKGGRHGRMLAWTSRPDRFDSNPAATEEEAMLFGTLVTKTMIPDQFRMLLSAASKGWSLDSDPADHTHLWISEIYGVDATAMESFIDGPGSGMGEAYVYIAEASATTHLGLFRAVFGAGYFTLYRADNALTAVDFNHVTVSEAHFLSSSVFTHGPASDVIGFASMGVTVIPARQRYTFLRSIAPADGTQVTDTVHGACNDWGTLLNPGAIDLLIWNPDANGGLGAVSDIVGAAGQTVTHNAYGGVGIVNAGGDAIYIFEKGARSMEGHRILLTDVGRQGQVSSLSLASLIPVGGSGAGGGTTPSLYHTEINVPVMDAVTGTAALNPVNDFRFFIHTANLAGNLGISDIRLYGNPVCGEGEAELNLFRYRLDATTILDAWARYRDLWFHKTRMTDVQNMPDSVIVGDSVKVDAGQVSFVAEDADIRRMPLYPWTGGGGKRENELGALSVRVVHVPVQHPDVTYRPVSAVAAGLDIEVAHDSDTWATTSPMLPGNSQLVANVVAPADECVAFGFRISGIPDAALLYRFMADIVVDTGTVTASGDGFLFARLTRHSAAPALASGGMALEGYTNGGTARIYSEPNAWAFLMASPGNVPEGITYAECQGRNDVHPNWPGTFAAAAVCPTGVPPVTSEVRLRVRGCRSTFNGMFTASGGYPVWLPRYEIRDVSPWVIGATTYEGASFVRLQCAAGAQVEEAAHAGAVDVTQRFGLRVTPFLRWDAPVMGTAPLREVAAGILDRPISVATADQLVVWKAGEPMRSFPIIGPGVREFGGVDWTGLVVYDPGNELTAYAGGGYGAIPAFGTKGLTVWVGFLCASGASAFAGVVDATLVDANVEYMPITQDAHTIGEYFLLAKEPDYIIP